MDPESGEMTVTDVDEVLETLFGKQGFVPIKNGRYNMSMKSRTHDN